MQVGEWPFAVKPGKTSENRIDHSSGVVAVDRWGDIAAVTHTIYTALWGKTGIFVGGISIPDSVHSSKRPSKRRDPASACRTR